MLLIVAASWGTDQQGDGPMLSAGLQLCHEQLVIAVPGVMTTWLSSTPLKLL